MRPLPIAKASDHLGRDISGIAQRAVAALLVVSASPAALPTGPVDVVWARAVARIRGEALLYQSLSNLVVRKVGNCCCRRQQQIKQARDEPDSAHDRRMTVGGGVCMRGRSLLCALIKILWCYSEADGNISVRPCFRRASAVASFSARPGAGTPSGRPGSCDCSG